MTRVIPPLPPTARPSREELELEEQETLFAYYEAHASLRAALEHQNATIARAMAVGELPAFVGEQDVESRLKTWRWLLSKVRSVS